jgi:hypothetical protein
MSPALALGPGSGYPDARAPPSRAPAASRPRTPPDPGRLQTPDAPGRFGAPMRTRPSADQNRSNHRSTPSSAWRSPAVHRHLRRNPRGRPEPMGRPTAGCHRPGRHHCQRLLPARPRPPHRLTTIVWIDPVPPAAHDKRLAYRGLPQLHHPGSWGPRASIGMEVFPGRLPRPSSPAAERGRTEGRTTNERPTIAKGLF